MFIRIRGAYQGDLGHVWGRSRGVRLVSFELKLGCLWRLQAVLEIQQFLKIDNWI